MLSALGGRFLGSERSVIVTVRSSARSFSRCSLSFLLREATRASLLRSFSPAASDFFCAPGVNRTSSAFEPFLREVTGEYSLTCSVSPLDIFLRSFPETARVSPMSPCGSAEFFSPSTAFSRDSIGLRESSSSSGSSAARSASRRARLISFMRWSFFICMVSEVTRSLLVWNTISSSPPETFGLTYGWTYSLSG